MPWDSYPAILAADVHTGHPAAFFDEGDDQAFTHIGRSADHIINPVSSVHLEQMELFGIGMGFYGEDFSSDNVLQILSHVENILHLGGGKGEPAD